MYLVEFINYCRFHGPSKHPVVYGPAAGAVIFSKNALLDVWNMYLIEFANIWGPRRSSGLGEPALRAGEICWMVMWEPAGLITVHCR